MSKQNAFLGIDVGSISTKAVILDEGNAILAQEYIWTEGNPIGAVKKLLGLLEKQFDPNPGRSSASGQPAAPAGWSVPSWVRRS